LYADDYWRTIYENEFWKKRKSEMAEIRELLKKVPPVNLVSSTITIEIVGDGISKEQALKIAEDICKEEGWEWVDVGINENGDYWDINTQKSRLGANAFIRINKKSGEVSEKYITGP
jgi:hypothetical protein